MNFVRAEPTHTYHNENYLSWFDKFFVKTRNHTDGMNQNMFNEDFQNIFRYADRHSNKLFDIKTNSDTLAHRLLDGFETQYNPRSTDERLKEVIEDIVQSFLSNGNAFYYLHDNDEKSDTRVVSYSFESIFRIAGYLFQYLPTRVEKDWERKEVKLRRELRLLNVNKALCFVWSVSFRRRISIQNRVLAALDKHDGSVALSFLARATLENPYPRSDFNFKQWRDAQDLALYKATRQTGWNGRKYDSQKRSDFFDCHRLIRFRRNQLGLRDQILLQLSSELTRVGRSYSKNFHLELSPSEALPSVSQLDDLAARLSREEVGFSEVMDYCFKT
jgi:hypothetical protein